MHFRRRRPSFSFCLSTHFLLIGVLSGRHNHFDHSHNTLNIHTTHNAMQSSAPHHTPCPYGNVRTNKIFGSFISTLQISITFWQNCMCFFSNTIEIWQWCITLLHENYCLFSVLLPEFYFIYVFMMIEWMMGLDFVCVCAVPHSLSFFLFAVGFNLLLWFSFSLTYFFKCDG